VCSAALMSRPLADIGPPRHLLTAHHVILDATLIRLLLVPAIMKVAGGKANWWLPGFLERILPKVKVE